MDNSTISLVEKHIKDFIEDIRPIEELRDKIDYGYTFSKNTLEVFSIRPSWTSLNEKIQSPFAKTRFVKAQDVWKIYWMRASGKWEAYTPTPEVNSIYDFFELVKEDKHNCFFG